jgi:hypothetical protein
MYGVDMVVDFFFLREAIDMVVDASTGHSRCIAFLKWAWPASYYFHGPNIDNWAGLWCAHLACPSLLALSIKRIYVTWPVHDVLGWRSDEVHRLTPWESRCGDGSRFSLSA